jgi:hypothetical protein
MTAKFFVGRTSSPGLPDTLHFFVMAQFNVIYVFCIYLRINSDLRHLQHKLIGVYNPDEKCLQRGTNWGFK